MRQVREWMGNREAMRWWEMGVTAVYDELQPLSIAVTLSFGCGRRPSELQYFGHFPCRHYVTYLGKIFPRAARLSDCTQSMPLQVGWCSIQDTQIRWLQLGSIHRAAVAGNAAS